MSPPASAAPPTTQTGKPVSIDFHPNIWGDLFLTLPHHVEPSDAAMDHELLKQQVRKMLTNISDEPPQKLRLIDAVQRLGVSYHFTSEIDAELQKLAQDSVDEDDIYLVALRFRLLRQQGIRFPCDIFEKFRDCKGKFKESLKADVGGLLSLYEAAQLGMRGEAILEEAIAFATKNLELALTHVSPHQGEEIRRALNRPIRKWLPRLEARHYIAAYSRDECHNRSLLKFAKIDFTMLQRLHQKELQALAGWWKSLDTTTKFPFARDRIVELYFWILGVYFEPQYTHARMILTKIISVTSIIDDTYDNFGTYEELQLLTEAIQRWNERAIDMVPERMKLTYSILFNTYKEIEEEFAEAITPHGMHYVKEAMKKGVRFYLAEAKWRDQGYIPSVKEYMDVSMESSGFSLITASSFIGMGEIATKEAFEWVSNDPFIRASSIICRLMDDIAGHKDEQQREHVASAIECYMKQHAGVAEEVVKLFQKEIADAWKDINQECLRPTTVAMPLLERALNLARSMDFMYKDNIDGYTNPLVIKDHVASLLLDPIDIL